MVKKFVKAARRADKQHISRIRAVRPSRSIEAWYRGELLALVKSFRKSVETEVLPMVEKAVQKQQITGDASIIELIDAKLARLGAQFEKAVGKRAGKLADALVSRSDRQVIERLAAMATAAFSLNLAGFLRRSDKLSMAIDAGAVANINLITSLPVQYLDRVKSGVMAAVMSGTRWEGVRDDILRFGVVTENRAKLIARDQVSKLNSTINRIRQTELGIVQYKWSTSGDERVRPTHRENDGKVFDWNDPPAVTGHPGEDYQCRCVAIPIIDLAGDD